MGKALDQVRVGAEHGLPLPRFGQHHAHANDLGARRANQRQRTRKARAGGDHVVDDQHPLAGEERNGREIEEQALLAFRGNGCDGLDEGVAEVNFWGFLKDNVAIEPEGAADLEGDGDAKSGGADDDFRLGRSEAGRQRRPACAPKRTPRSMIIIREMARSDRMGTMGSSSG